MKRVILYAAIAALLLSFAAVQTPNTARSSPATARANTVKPAVKPFKPLGTAAPVVMMTPGSITAKITAWLLPLRDGPSRKGKVLMELRHNTVVTVIGVNRFHTWIKVLLSDAQPGAAQPATAQPGSGQTGWISVYYVLVKGGLLKSVPVMAQ